MCCGKNYLFQPSSSFFPSNYLHNPNKCLNFATPEPAKPLNDAQMCGSFLYISMAKRIPFSKAYIEESGLIALLQSRGLFIPDVSKARHYLTHIGYYRLSAYMYPLLRIPKDQHLYKRGAAFDKVMMLYRFDKKLRFLLFNEIEKIEVAVRSAIVKHGCEVTNDPFWMTTPCNFSNPVKYNRTIRLIEDELNHSKEEFCQDAVPFRRISRG